MKKMSRESSIPADPLQWSEKSQRSVSFHYVRVYTDIGYDCWRCKAPSVFTAEDQKFTYEVKKASIDQQRLLCRACWSESNQTRAALVNHEAMWAESKKSLQHDSHFLNGWLELLVKLEEFVPYKPDSAKKSMLKKMLLGLASNTK